MRYRAKTHDGDRVGFTRLDIGLVEYRWTTLFRFPDSELIASLPLEHRSDDDRRIAEALALARVIDLATVEELTSGKWQPSARYYGAANLYGCENGKSRSSPLL